MQCNYCSKKFQGRAFRANCHLIGKVGEGVEVCRLIPESVKLDFIKKVYPELLHEESIGKSSNEPAPKKLKQAQLGNFITSSNHALADRHFASLFAPQEFLFML